MEIVPASVGPDPPTSSTTGTDRRRSRGQSGIGSMIILIAALLVATVTAGVLFEVTGAFQDDAAQTGEESADRVVTRVEAITATGRVNQSGNTVDQVSIVLKRAHGSGSIDVDEYLVATAIGDGANAPVGDSDAVTLDPLVDRDGSLAEGRLDSDDDRLALRLDVRALTGAELRPGDTGTVRLVSPDGSSTSVRLDVPSSFGGRRTVSL